MKIEKQVNNKAGYTAISCGRVGRGGNARFPTFRLDGYGPTDGPTDRPTDGPTDQRTDRQTDKASYRVAYPQLKNGKFTFKLSGQGWTIEILMPSLVMTSERKNNPSRCISTVCVSVCLCIQLSHPEFDSKCFK